jgi:hypothetical protein
MKPLLKLKTVDIMYTIMGERADLGEHYRFTLIRKEQCMRCGFSLYRQSLPGCVCNGTKIMHIEDEIGIDVPPRVMTGDIVKVPRKGHTARIKGTHRIYTGHLYVFFHIVSPRYKCKVCKGTGRVDVLHDTTCPTCLAPVGHEMYKLRTAECPTCIPYKSTKLVHIVEE